MAKRVGILDVATAAGVSVATVSLALRGKGKMSDDTRARVERIAGEMGYAPNRIASALRRQRSGIIGFVSDEIATTPFAGRIVLGAQDAAADNDVLLIVVNSNGVDAIENRQIDALLAQQVDAILYAKMGHREVTLPSRLDGFPTVFVDAFQSGSSSPAVVPNEFEIGVVATNHLIRNGHSHIVHLTLETRGPGVNGRAEGYRHAMREAGFEPCVIFAEGPGDARAGRVAMTEALSAIPALTSIFAFNDPMAMGVYQTASALGLTVPGDVSVVGVDNLEVIAAQLQPGLTTVALPHYEMGRWAIERVIRMLGSTASAASAQPGSTDRPGGPGSPPVAPVRLLGELVERDSVRRLGGSVSHYVRTH